MTNEQLIAERWRFTDKRLEITDKKLKEIFRDIQDELLELFDEFKELTIDDLNKKAPDSLVRKLERKQKEWEDESIITPYFRYLLKTTKKTYGNIIQLLIFGIYLKYQEKQLDEFENLFVDIANDTFRQAKEEYQEQLPKKLPEKLTWNDVIKWTTVFTFGASFYEYLNILSQTASEDSYKLYFMLINQEIPPDKRELTKLIEKQKNRLLKINGDKHSGIIEHIAIQVGNKAYYEPFSNAKVVFIATLDNRTTTMCRSLHGQVFNTKDWNDFKRYSDVRGRTKKYHVFGLKEGVNLPPINDHFHFCRSMISFDLKRTPFKYIIK